MVFLHKGGHHNSSHHWKHLLPLFSHYHHDNHTFETKLLPISSHTRIHELMGRRCLYSNCSSHDTNASNSRRRIQLQGTTLWKQVYMCCSVLHYSNRYFLHTKQQHAFEHILPMRHPVQHSRLFIFEICSANLFWSFNSHVSSFHDLFTRKG